MAESFYVNITGVRLGPADIALLGALRAGPRPGENQSMISEDDADVLVYMSPVTAKLLLQGLRKSVEWYEQLHGEIRTEQDPTAINRLVEEVGNQQNIKMTVQHRGTESDASRE